MVRFIEQLLALMQRGALAVRSSVARVFAASWKCGRALWRWLFPDRSPVRIVVALLISIAAGIALYSGGGPSGPEPAVAPAAIRETHGTFRIGSEQLRLRSAIATFTNDDGWIVRMAENPLRCGGLHFFDNRGKPFIDLRVSPRPTSPPSAGLVQNPLLTFARKQRWTTVADGVHVALTHVSRDPGGIWFGDASAEGVSPFEPSPRYRLNASFAARLCAP